MPVIYSEKITSRVSYIFDTIFSDLLQTDYELTDSREEFSLSDQPKFSYGNTPIKDELFFTADDLLFENGIHEQSLKQVDYKDLPALFPVSAKDSALPFDPFAMAFYLLSRYEEYARLFQPDAHGRPSAQSFAVNRLKVAYRPVVNEIVYIIRNKLLERYPGLKFRESGYSFTPTYDIDMAFAHKGKSFSRTAGALAKLLLKMQPGEFAAKVKTLAGMKKDPFDNFDFLQEKNREYNLTPIYFVNLGDLSAYDKNVSYRNKDLRDLLKRLSEDADIGIHPSYYSDVHPEKIKDEKNRLEDILGTEVTKSRQHFLKIDMPETYRNLMAEGITDDYSNGFYSQPGFRSGITSPYYFYDLEKEQRTGLRVHPFGFMDTALSDYMQLPPAQWAAEVEPIIANAVKYNAPLMGIWHNYAIADKGERKKAFAEMIKIASRTGND